MVKVYRIKTTQNIVIIKIWKETICFLWFKAYASRILMLNQVDNTNLGGYCVYFFLVLEVFWENIYILKEEDERIWGESWYILCLNNAEIKEIVFPPRMMKGVNYLATYVVSLNMIYRHQQMAHLWVHPGFLLNNRL